MKAHMTTAACYLLVVMMVSSYSSVFFRTRSSLEAGMSVGREGPRYPGSRFCLSFSMVAGPTQRPARRDPGCGTRKAGIISVMSISMAGKTCVGHLVGRSNGEPAGGGESLWKHSSFWRSCERPKAWSGAERSMLYDAVDDGDDEWLKHRWREEEDNSDLPPDSVSERVIDGDDAWAALARAAKDLGCILRLAHSGDFMELGRLQALFRRDLNPNVSAKLEGQTWLLEEMEQAVLLNSYRPPHILVLSSTLSGLDEDSKSDERSISDPKLLGYIYRFDSYPRFLTIFPDY